MKRPTRLELAEAAARLYLDALEWQQDELAAELRAITLYLARPQPSTDETRSHVE